MDKRKRPGKEAVSPQDRRSGRTLPGSFCPGLAPLGRDWVVRGAGVTDYEGGPRSKEDRHDGTDSRRRGWL